MNILPVGQRELREASRRPATFRLRVLVAGSAFAVAMAFLIFNRSSQLALGGLLFNLLAAGAFLLCLAEGIYGTADTLSEGRREGTLGLLFLTDLSGHEVVLGKFAGAAIRSLTILFSAFPVFALPLLLGGVTPGEFVRVLVALGATLMVSLSAGLFCSSFSRSGIVAMGLTAALLGGLVILPSALDHFVVGSGFRTNPFLAILAGPFGALLRASDSGYQYAAVAYAMGLLGAAVWTVTLLAVAGWWLARSWRDDGQSLAAAWLRRIQPVLNPVWVHRSALGSADPARWLAERTLPGERLIWILVWTLCAVCVLGTLVGGDAASGFVVPLQWAGGYALKLWLAVLAPQSLNESRRSGALELLLVTDVSPRDLVRGQLETLRSYFVLPALTVSLGIGLACGLVRWDLSGSSLLFGGGWFLIFVLDFYAISQVGLWLGLTEARPGQAVAKTILWVLVVPWLTIIVPLLGCLGLILWPIAWNIWASNRLNGHFRDEVIRPLGMTGAGSSWWPFGRRSQ